MAEQIKSFSPGEPLDIVNLNKLITKVKEDGALLDQTRNTVTELDTKTKKQTISKVLNGIAPDGAGRTISESWTTGLTGTFSESFPETPSISITPVYTANNVIDIRVTKITQTNFTFDAKLMSKGSVNVVFYYIAVAQQQV